MSNKTSRDIRQEQCITNWVKAKGHATCECATGFGAFKIPVGHKKILMFKNK